MPKDFSIDIQGDEELMKFFTDLPKQFPAQVLGDVSQKGAAVIRAEARRMMPVDGELGRVGKKAVIIAKGKQNKTERVVTIGNGYFDLDGKQISIGKIIRHMSAGGQKNRKTKKGQQRGKVAIRGGDFIQKAFTKKAEQALQVMKDNFYKIIEKRVKRTKGLTYGR
ncbi:MAG TPA: hypothetical protein PK059_02055 [Cyclobacteriaceae bacterium]|nr:hypothetical protein [Cyclobacteriaceae bacterium]